MSKFQAFVLPIIISTIFSAGTEAQAQWSSLKPALQSGVQIVKETTTRLVLYHQSGDSLVLTPWPEKDSDIYGAFEVKRGGNPYRVWVATEKLLNNPRFAGEAGKIFFRETFLSALRQDPPPPEPAQKELDLTNAPDSGRTPIAKTSAKEFNLAAVPTPLTALDSLPRSAKQDSSPVARESKAQLAEATFKTHANSPRARRKLVEIKNKPHHEKMAPPVQPTASRPEVVISHARLDSLYQTALVAINQADWQQAAFNLEKIQLLQPNYREVVDLLAQTRVNLASAEKPEAAAKSPQGGASVFVGGAIAALGVFFALIVLPFIGVVLVSPTVRVRYHIFRGQYAEAAQIYEKLLVRRPNRKKLYPTLANLYLRLGRRDEAALKVYEMALQLDIAERHREEINSIVSNNYLTKGRTDARAIEVLEDALKAERLKQKKRKS